VQAADPSESLRWRLGYRDNEPPLRPRVAWERMRAGPRRRADVLGVSAGPFWARFGRSGSERKLDLVFEVSDLRTFSQERRRLSVSDVLDVARPAQTRSYTAGNGPEGAAAPGAETPCRCGATPANAGVVDRRHAAAAGCGVDPQCCPHLPLMKAMLVQPPLLQ
jgi:hypothetical protein